VNVLSVDAFTRAINQAQGTNGVLQHLRFVAQQSTGWHVHPEPNIVFVVNGLLTLTDQHCNVTTYGPGQAFATGLDVHEAVAGPEGPISTLSTCCLRTPKCCARAKLRRAAP
jgi:quercetin dioxygenase-like cupin family protein